MSALKVQSLEVRFDRAAPLFRVDLSLEPKQLVALRGIEGVGKSSFIRAIMGTLPRARVTGSVRLGDAEISAWPTHRRVEAGLGCVPEGRGLFGGLTVAENLRMGGWLRAGSREAAQRDLLARFPLLAARTDQRAATLSGGEQQMLAIARALMSRPKYLLLDEPTLGLAPKVAAQIADTLRVVAETGVGVLVAQSIGQLDLPNVDRSLSLTAQRSPTAPR